MGELQRPAVADEPVKRAPAEAAAGEFGGAAPNLADALCLSIFWRLFCNVMLCVLTKYLSRPTHKPEAHSKISRSLTQHFSLMLCSTLHSDSSPTAIGLATKPLGPFPASGLDLTGAAPRVLHPRSTTRLSRVVDLYSSSSFFGNRLACTRRMSLLDRIIFRS